MVAVLRFLAVHTESTEIQVGADTFPSAGSQRTSAAPEPVSRSCDVLDGPLDLNLLWNRTVHPRPATPPRPRTAAPGGEFPVLQFCCVQLVEFFSVARPPGTPSPVLEQASGSFICERALGSSTSQFSQACSHGHLFALSFRHARGASKLSCPWKSRIRHFADSPPPSRPKLSHGEIRRSISPAACEWLPRRLRAD